jgi:lipid II:glycine glycyltransferase (peptidoglycan interpeptide bridge formation enzyme)
MEHPNGNIFQTLEMYNIYDSTKNYQPIFVGAVNNKNEILGILVSVIQKEFSGLLSSLSSRCVTWGGPLIKKGLNINEKKKILFLILKKQNNITRKKAIYMQFRNIWDTSQYNSTFAQNNYNYEDHLDILIDISKPEDELMTNMTKNRRKGIKRAQKQGQQFFEFPKNQSLNTIYEMIQKTYDNVKVPLANISFFNKARKIMNSKGFVKYFCVKNDNELLATRLVLTYKNNIYDWYAGSSEIGKKNYANEFLVWNILTWGHQNGYKIFDFGGAGKPNEEYGPREFKRRFGGEFVNYGRYQNVFKKTKLKVAHMGLKIMKSWR